jgi:predicted thioredoxin/glutaredoxin
VVKHLIKKELIDNVELIDTSKVLNDVLTKSIISVPWIEVNNQAIASDPIHPEFAEYLITGNKDKLSKYLPNDVDEAVEEFKRGLLASSYASSVILIHNSLDPILRSDFPIISSKLRLTSIKSDDLLIKLNARHSKILDDIKPKSIRILTRNFVRESYLINNEVDEAYFLNIDAGVLATWLLAKASVGRAIMPTEPEKLLSLGNRMKEILQERARDYLNDVLNEQKMIRNDKEYLSILLNI